MLAAVDRAGGYGAASPGGSWSPALDRAPRAAPSERDIGRREALPRKAAGIGMRDHGVLPPHWEVTAWASRAGIVFEPRLDPCDAAPDARPRE